MIKKNLKIFFVMLLFYLIGYGIGNAQEEAEFYIGISTLYAFESFDEENTQDKFMGNVSVDFDNTWGLQIKGGYIINEYFSGEGRVEYLIPAESELGYDYESDLEVFNASLNGKVTIPIKEYFIPYGLLGFGIVNSYEKITGPQSNKKSDWGIGSRIGFGADIPIHQNVAIGFEVSYLLGFGNVDHVRYGTIGIGALYRF